MTGNFYEKNYRRTGSGNMKDFIAYHFSERAFGFLSRFPACLKKPATRLIPAVARAGLHRRRFPSSLTIFVTRRCNLHCRHCFIRKSPGNRDEQEMSNDDYGKLFRSLKGRISSIKITGGEPTLRDDLGQIVRAASITGGVKYVTLFTNGTGRHRLRDILEGIIHSCPVKLSVQVSLDGDERLHDEIRGRKGAFQDAVSAMKDLSGIRAKYPRRILRLSAGTCVMRENEHQIKAIAGIVKSCGFDHVVSFPRSSRRHVFNIGDDWKSDDYPAYDEYWSMEETAQCFNLLDQVFWAGENVSLYKKANKIVLETMADMIKNSQPATPCYSGKADLVIYPGGAVARCEMLKGVVNLEDYHFDLEALVRSTAYRDYLNATDGCWCLNDCAISTAMIYEPRLFEKWL